MIERIRKICAGLDEVSAWKLNITQKQSSELFFVGKKLETKLFQEIIPIIRRFFRLPDGWADRWIIRRGFFRLN